MAQRDCPHMRILPPSLQLAYHMVTDNVHKSIRTRSKHAMAQCDQQIIHILTVPFQITHHGQVAYCHDMLQPSDHTHFSTSSSAQPSIGHQRWAQGRRPRVNTRHGTALLINHTHPSTSCIAHQSLGHRRCAPDHEHTVNTRCDMS